MNPDVRTAGVNGLYRANATRRSALTLLLSLVVFATAACSDMAPPASSASVAPQPGLPTLGPTHHTSPVNVLQPAATRPATARAAGADEKVHHHVADAGGDKTHAIFLHGLHSPFGLALAVSRIPTPR